MQLSRIHRPEAGFPPLTGDGTLSLGLGATPPRATPHVPTPGGRHACASHSSPPHAPPTPAPPAPSCSCSFPTCSAGACLPWLVSAVPMLLSD